MAKPRLDATVAVRRSRAFDRALFDSHMAVPLACGEGDQNGWKFGEEVRTRLLGEPACPSFSTRLVPGGRLGREAGAQD